MPPIQNQPTLGPATQQDQRYQVLDTHPGFSLFLGYGSEWPVQDPHMDDSGVTPERGAESEWSI